MEQTKIDINHYNYLLPDNRIARYPNESRSGSKLLVYKPGEEIRHTVFAEIGRELKPGNLLVYNNTRVIHARLVFYKETGAQIEIFILTPRQPADYHEVFNQTCCCTWSCMVGNLKKWKNGTLQTTIKNGENSFVLKAKKSGTDEKTDQLITFTWDGGLSFAEILNLAGKIPIPPYLNRESEEIDTTRYQTIYSQFDGSVAAPTAGLHFTPQVFANLKSNGTSLAEITLHVGAGTFQPVKAINALDHKMHGEQIIISEELLKNLLLYKGRVIATGTTSLRALETLYWLGVKTLQAELPAHLGQWDWQALPQNFSFTESINGLLNYIGQNKLHSLSALTEIMIIPGYRFRIANALITNFHQPKSTLLLLVAAFVGDKWEHIYNYAMQNNFNFLSYGDSSLLYAPSPDHEQLQLNS
ncbi:MAG: S-adenosylmethionine:tRNA ribosyltransferase-isomerase [Bacteroidales bacterium]|nr:S-adenosylmethionine:tRNA ribosyltransferase-isomerase [Bacteroidales bacterium]